MIQRLRNLSALKGKKRYMVLGLLAVELMSLPAAAKIVQTVSFDSAPTVVAVEIPTVEPGLSRFLVASDAGFIVKTNDLIGDVSVNLHVSGKLGAELRFGDAAQLPGPQVACTQSTEPNSEIYHASQATAAREGTAPERAVIFEFQYASDQHPEFEFIAGKPTTSTLTRCKAVKL